jgi:hypothetical protein
MVPTVALDCIGKDLVPAQITKVHIYVRHADPAGVEETLKIQIIGQRVNPGDIQQVSNNAAPRRAPTRPHGDALAAGKPD